LGTPASRDAMEKNLSAGRPQTLAMQGVAPITSEVK
jgi:hypothetical protein